MVKSYTINVDIVDNLAQNGYSGTVYNQGDINSAILNINVTQNEKTYDLTGATVSVVFNKPDGTVVYQDSTNGLTITNAVNGNISVNLNTQTLTAVGKVTGAIKIVNGTTTVETGTFSFTVKKSLTSEPALASDNELSPIFGTSTLTTTDKSIKGAINEVNANKADKTTVGDLTTLTTTDKDTLVHAINDNVTMVSTKADKTALGDITTLTTQNKTNVVAAINENVSSLADIALYVRKFQRAAGETDDTGRLQRALNQASTNGGGIVNYAENLTFSTITVPSGVILKGDGFHALSTTTTTGNAIIIGNGTGVSYYTALDHVVISSPNITTGNVIYVSKAQHFALPYTRLIGNPSTLTGTGIYIDGTNIGYNAQTDKAYISSFNIGVNAVNSSNAHTFFDTFFFNCNYGAIVQGSNGVRFIACTFQDFYYNALWFKVAVSGSQTIQNTVIGNYMEAKQGGTTIVSAVLIDANVSSTMLFGNKYSNLQPNYPELIDNGIFTSRYEYSGSSWNEPAKQGALTTLPKVTEGSLPLASAMTKARGSLAIGTSSGVIDLLRILLNDSTGNPQWMKVPVIDNTGTLNLNGVTVTNTPFASKPLVGTNVSANTPRFYGDLYVDTSAKIGYMAVGLTSTDWKQITN